MTVGSVNPGRATPPILVLGLGNMLLRDDGIGPLLVEQLSHRFAGKASQVEFLDGGTQGLALMGHIADRRALVILDALATGQKPGTVSVLAGLEALAFPAHRATTAHESNASELLATAAMLGDLPEHVYAVGIEPASITTGIGFSDEVDESLALALQKAENVIQDLLLELEEPTSTGEDEACAWPFQERY